MFDDDGGGANLLDGSGLLDGAALLDAATTAAFNAPFDLCAACNALLDSSATTAVFDSAACNALLDSAAATPLDFATVIFDSAT